MSSDTIANRTAAGQTTGEVARHEVGAEVGPDALLVGEVFEDWTGDARYFEYTRAANPIGSGQIPGVPLERFDAVRHRQAATGIHPFDVAAQLGLDDGPATSPALCASFIRIHPGDRVATQPVATSELYYVLRGSGFSAVNGELLRWSQGDFFVLPAGSRSVHHGVVDTTIYWVTDEPLLRYLGVAPTQPRFRPTHFPGPRCDAELDAIAHAPHATDRNRLAVLLNTAPNPQTQTVTHVLWAMYGLLPVDAVQRPHRHQSVALDLIVDCEPGCYTLVGRSIDERGEIVRPTRVDWQAGGAFITPPGLWHAHHNESGAPARLIPIQDAGLQTYLRSLDIRFAPSAAAPSAPSPTPTT